MSNLLMRLSSIVVFATLCAGCGESSNDESKDATNPARDRLVGTWAMECEIDDTILKEQIVERAKNGRKSRTLSEAELQQALDRMKTMINGTSMTLTLKADGTMSGITKKEFDLSRIDDSKPKGTMVTENDTGEGSWKAETEDDGRITLTLIQTPKTKNRRQPKGKESPGRPRETRFIITFENDSTFVVAETTKEKMPGTVRFRKQ